MDCKSLIQNIILLAYADIYNKRQYDIIGTKEDGETLQIYSYKFESEEYEQVYEHKFDKKIFSVLSGNFEKNGKTSIIIIFKELNKYYMKHMQFNISNNIISTDITDLDYSDTPPMIGTDYSTLCPGIIYKRNKYIKIKRYDLQKKSMTNENLIELKDNEDLDLDHPYSFIDLDGDLKSNLVLIIKNNNKRFIKIYKMRPVGYQEIFQMELTDKEIGPILFGDFNNSGLNSMVFVSKEDDQYFLNLYFNNLKRHDPKYYKTNILSAEVENNNLKIFSTDSSKKIPFNNLKQDYKPILKVDLQEKDLSIPGGIFITDINLDGFLELFITVKNPDNNLVILPLCFNIENNEFEFYEQAEELLIISNIISFSTVDFDNRGKENIIINRVKDTKLIIESYTNILNDNNMKLSLTTTLLDDKLESYGMGFPGTSYLMISNHGSSLSISNNFGQGPFLHLVSQTCTIGLGDSTFIIDCLKIGVPSCDPKFNSLYVIRTNIIQNFDLIILISQDGKYKIEAFFKIVNYAQRIIYVLITVITANIMIVLILYWKENQKLKLARTKDSMHPLFRSL